MPRHGIGRGPGHWLCPECYASGAQNSSFIGPGVTGEGPWSFPGRIGQLDTGFVRGSIPARADHALIRLHSLSNSTPTNHREEPNLKLLTCGSGPVPARSRARDPRPSLPEARRDPRPATRNRACPRPATRGRRGSGRRRSAPRSNLGRAQHSRALTDRLNDARNRGPRSLQDSACPPASAPDSSPAEQGKAAPNIPTRPRSASAPRPTRSPRGRPIP